MNLKRNNWTNDEVISLLQSISISTPNNDKNLEQWNAAILQCKYLFYDMKADPNISYGAKALDIDTGNVICVSHKLPQ